MAGPSPKKSLSNMIRSGTSTKKGGGRADDVPGIIKETGEPVQVSQGEFVIPADVVAVLGEGDIEKGGRILQAFVDKMREDTDKKMKSEGGPSLSSLLK